MSPDQFSLDGLEEGLNSRIVVAIAFARHRYFEPMLAQELLIIMRTVLAAPIRVMNAAIGRLPERDGHLQRSDRQVTFHPIAHRPADHTP